MQKRQAEAAMPAALRPVDAAQQAARLVAKPPCRAHHAEVTAQPGFHPTGMRFFYHNDERWFHVK